MILHRNNEMQTSNRSRSIEGKGLKFREVVPQGAQVLGRLGSRGRQHPQEFAFTNQDVLQRIAIQHVQ